MILSVQPTPIQAGEVTIYLTGLFMYREEQAGDASALAFLREFLLGTADFECCTGSYRMRIACPDGREIYFADNAGIMRWYIGPKGFFTTLREAAPENRTPDYPALAQFFSLAYGRIHGTSTVIREVRRSDPLKYYEVRNGTTIGIDKGLCPISELPAGPDALEKQMLRFARAVEGAEGIVCTITGGADSRLILAHMLHAGMDPVLDITGTDSHPDVVIAKQGAARLGKDILHIAEAPEPGWIDEAIQAADGMTGVCGLYRLYKKAHFLHEKGLVLECGGGGGEFYKNSFINLDYPFYGGKPNWKRFLRVKSILTDPNPVLFSGETAAEVAKAQEKELAYLKTYTGKTKANAYLSAYHDILWEGSSPGCSMNSRYYIPYIPMLERNVTAMAYHTDPHKMDGWAIHREQVSRLAPEIKDIKTDHGMTLDIDRMKAENLALLKYWTKAGLRMVTNRKKQKSRIDTCFEEGLSSPQYRAALERCKELGIIAPEVNDLPMAIADRVFALGTIL